jgi:hypothetical protein
MPSRSGSPRRVRDAYKIRTDSGFEQEFITDVRFVPMTGKAQDHDQAAR